MRALQLLAIAAAAATFTATAGAASQEEWTLTGRVVECKPTCTPARARYILCFYDAFACERVVHTRSGGRFATTIGQGSYNVHVFLRRPNGRAGAPMLSRPGAILTPPGPWRLTVRVYGRLRTP